MIKKIIKNPVFVFLLLIVGITFYIFKPVFLDNKTPISSNLLVSFYNPWAKEKFSGWEGGIPNKPVGIDDLRIFYPQRLFTINMFRNFELPFWNPYNFSGNPHIALAETGVFYPLSIIFLLISQDISWSVLIIVQPIIAGIGMYLFLSRIITNKSAVLFGGIVFAFSSIVIVRAQEGLSVGHVLIWFPYVLYGIESFLKDNKIRYLLISLIALVLSFLSGWFQFFFYIYAFSFIYLCVRIISDKSLKNKKKLLIAFLIFLLLPLLVLYQLIPALELLYMSPRGQSNYENLSSHLMPIQHLITFVFPDFWGNPGSYNFFGKSEYKESVLYFGIIPLFFTLLSSKLWKNNKNVKFFAVAGILGLIVGTNNFLSDVLLKLPIPIVSSFLPNRIFLISIFSFSVLSAIGIGYFLDNYRNVRFKSLLKTILPIAVVIVIISSYVALCFLINYFYIRFSANESNIALTNTRNLLFNFGLISEQEWQITVQIKNTILPTFLFGVLIIILLLKNRFNKNVFFGLVLAVTVFSQVYFAQKYLTFSEKEFIFPNTNLFSYLQKNSGINRFISVGEGYIPSNFPLFFKLYSPDGVSSMYIRRYGELASFALAKGKIEGNIPRVETRIEPSVEDLFSENNRYLLRFMQITGTSYVLKYKHDVGNNKTIQENDLFELIWEDEDWQVYKYRNVGNRIFWTNKYIVEKDDSKILNEVFKEDLDLKTIVLEEHPEIKEAELSAGEIELIEYSPSRIVLNSSSDAEGLIYISDNYFPNFKAEVDGEKTKIMRANYSFRAIPVRKGNHSVVIYYDGSVIYYSLIFTVILILVSGVGVSVLVLKKKYLF